MEWVSLEPKIRTWLSSNTSSLLWINGSPGQGKSVLCKYLLDFLENKVKNQQRTTATSMVIHFFCSSQLDPRFKDAATILKTFIVQLLSLPHMFEHLPEQYQNESEKFQTAPLVSLWKIFSDMICDGNSRHIYCLIDAVDEFGERETQGLLERMQNLFGSTNVSSKRSVIKFLLTSRPETYVSRCMTNAITMSLQARRENIQRLVDSKVKALRSDFDDFKAEIEEWLGSQAGSTFLWVDIIIKRIDRLSLPNRRKIRIEIDDTPVELQHLYKTLTHKICEEEDNARLLIWVLYARRPLMLPELEVALAVRPEERQDCIEDLEEVKTALTDTSVRNSAGLLVEIIDGAVYLIHQSVKDFLLSNFPSIFMEHDATNQFLHNIDAETFLTSSCVRYLSFRDFESSSLFELLYSAHDGLEVRRRYPFLEYASANWYWHIRTPDQTLLFSEDINKILCPTNVRTMVWFAVARRRSGGTLWFNKRWSRKEELKSRAEIAIKLDIGWLAKIMLGGATILVPEERIPISHLAKAAAEGSEIMDVLVEFCKRHSSSITTNVLKAAAENWIGGLEVMELLLDRLGADIPITADVVKAAAENWGSGFRIMELLLDRRGADIPITAGVVKAAAENQGRGLQIMELLLDRRGANIPITADVVKAAAGNWDSGFPIVELLLNRPSTSMATIAEVFKVAVEDPNTGGKLLELLNTGGRVTELLSTCHRQGLGTHVTVSHVQECSLGSPAKEREHQEQKCSLSSGCSVREHQEQREHAKST